MAIIVRKNNQASNALAGLERGLATGLGFGLDVARQQKNNEEDQFRRQQAIEQARRIDEQIQRENSERAAAQEGIATIAEPSADPMMRAPNMAGPAIAGAMQQDKRARIAEIAKRMDPRAAFVFIEEAKRREVDDLMERERSKLRDDMARAKSEGSFRSIPDEGGLLSPEEVAEGDAEFESGVDRIAALLADPNSNPLQLRAEYGQLRKGRIVAKGKAAGRLQTLTQLKEQAASLATPPTPRQAQALATMQELFKMSPETYDDPRAMQEFQQRYADALQGYTMVGRERVKFEDEDVVRRLMIQEQQARNALIQAQRGYYEAGAAQRETPKPALPEKDRISLALKMRAQANDADTPPAEAAKLRAQADALERGATWNPEEAAAEVFGGAKPKRGWTEESARAAVRKLIQEGKHAEADKLAAEAAEEIAGANGG